MKDVLFASFGRDATALLRQRIDRAQAGDPLAPVTVVVPSNFAGLSLRRSLGAGRGLVNVRFMVLGRVAELLGAPTLANEGRRPLTPAVSREAVRAALQEAPGYLAPIATHAATARSLESTFHDLRRMSGPALNRVAAGSGRVATVARLYRRFRELTDRYYDATALAEAAARAARDGSPALRDLGHTIVFLPRDLVPAEVALLEALAARGMAEVIIGTANDRQAGEVTARLANALGVAFQGANDRHHVSAGTRIVTVTDPEEELRQVLRIIASEVDRGTPLHRVAVLYRSREPYAQLTHEQFQAAGIPHNGAGIETLAQSLAGAGLVGLLRLRERNFERDAVMDWLTSAPIRESTARPGLVPSQRWERMSRAAGVSAGAGQWAIRLERRARYYEGRAGRAVAEDGDETAGNRYLGDARSARSLAAFVAELEAISEPPAEPIWRAHAGWCLALLNRYLGHTLALPGLDSRKESVETEQRAYDDLRGVVEELGGLDHAVAGTAAAPVTEEVFRRELDDAISARPIARLGPFGDGVFIGQLNQAVGMSFDLVFVLGMVEGQLPPIGQEDPLLPDDERRTLSPALPLRAARRNEERRDYLAALASATSQVLLFPRAELRGQSENLPARWLLEAASDLATAGGATSPVFTREFARLQENAGRDPAASTWLTSLPSFTAALQRTAVPASEQEYDLRSLLSANAPRRHFLVLRQRQLAHGIAATVARAGGSVSEWDGLLSPDERRAPSVAHPTSPTALQGWAQCPFSYFLRTVLHVAETERPEETLSISPTDRGTLIHRVLQSFFNGARGRTGRENPWAAEDRALLATIAANEFREAEEAGLTGMPLLWAIDRRRIARDLDLFLDADEDRRRNEGYFFERAEFAFGMDGRPPLTLNLPGGRSVAFRGSIDRVDRGDDGGLAVTDYKSGSMIPYKDIEKAPLLHGKLLQLPVYGLAASQAFDVDAVAASYWFVSERESFTQRGYEVSQTEPAGFIETVQTIVGGIEAGLFPAHPGKPDDFHGTFDSCRFCAYDSLCQRDRARAWLRKRDAPGITAYVDLAGTEGDGDND